MHDDLPIGAVDDNRGGSLRRSVGDGGIGPALVAAAEHVIAYGTTVHLDGRPAEQGAFDQSLIECSLPEALSAAKDAARHRAVAYYDRDGTRGGNGVGKHSGAGYRSFAHGAQAASAVHVSPYGAP